MQFVQEHRTWLAWAAGGSAALLVLFGVGLPVVAVMLPADAVRRYLREGPGEALPEADWRRQHPVVRWTLRGLKNALGVVLLLAGLAMLILPGQGLLTLAVAMLLLDFPGKRGVERRLLGSPRVLGPVNALRRRFGKEPMLGAAVHGGHGDTEATELIGGGTGCSNTDRNRNES